MSRYSHNKKNAQYIHFKRNLKSRYGLNINRVEKREIVEKIKSGEAELLEKQTLRISVYKVIFKNVPVIIVYDKLRESLCTCLPSDCQLSTA